MNSESHITDGNFDKTSPRRGTRKWVLFCGLSLAVLALVFWRPAQRGCLAFFLLRAEAPADDTLSEAVEHAPKPGVLLARLWRSGRFPQRQFVMRYLGQICGNKPELFHELDPLLVEATGDPDVETRQLAFSALTRARNPHLRSLAMQQLADSDPAVRLLGLQSLRAIATSNDVPVAMRFLSDSEPRVVVAAAMVLRQATGLDFGIKSTHALAQFSCIGTNPPPPPDIVAIREGTTRWQEWWGTHNAEFPAGPAFFELERRTELPLEDFHLEEFSGRQVQVSQFRGKPVLLVFWSVGVPASFDDSQALLGLERRHSDRLAILGICLPPPPSCLDAHDHDDGQDQAHHHHHDDSPGPTSRSQMVAQVREIVYRSKITFPMLVDSKGTIGSRFKAEDLPVYVLISPQGTLLRRLVGFRTERDLDAIVTEALAARAP